MQQFQLLHAEQQQQFLQLDAKLAEKMDQIDQDIKSQGNFYIYIYIYIYILFIIFLRYL